MELPIRETASTVLNLMFNKPFYRMIFMPWKNYVRRKMETAGLLGQREAMAKHNTVDRLPLIKAPTLVICGTKDDMTPLKYSHYLADKISGATLVAIQGATHMAFMEEPQEVNRAIEEFIKHL